MLYFKCPTCKTNLADKQLPLEKGLEKICKDTRLSEHDKDIATRKLLDDIGIKMPCCRMRALTYTKLIDMIK